VVSPWKVILAAAVIFACGGLTGAMVSRASRQAALAAPLPPAMAVNPKNPAPPGWQLQRLAFFRKMEKQLDLAPDQREQIDKIMKDSQDRVKPLWDQIGPQMGAELKRVRQEVSKVLTPEQRKKMNELMRHGRKPEGGGPNGEHPFRPADATQVETNAF
jgi:Spy/CpxP family protein refolding chaperone